MPPMGISFAESALCDLEEVRVWYTEQGAPEFNQPFLRELIPLRFVSCIGVITDRYGSSVFGVANACGIFPSLIMKKMTNKNPRSK